MDGLTAAQLKRLRVLVWRAGVVFLRWPIPIVVRFRVIETLRAWRAMAARYPEIRGTGPFWWAYNMLAPVWRTWLRLRGLHYRIGRRTNSQGRGVHGG
jgi:hypothetical protein